MRLIVHFGSSGQHSDAFQQFDMKPQLSLRVCFLLEM